MADLVVTNVTESYTNGKALEGTVNRILVKLQAAPHENCTDVTFRVSCTSLLITLEGTTKKITSGLSAEEDKGSAVDCKVPGVRTPVLVTRDQHASSSQTEYGFELPAGWALCGDGQANQDTYKPVVPALKGGEVSYAYFDLFRPTPRVTRMDGVLQVGEQADDLIGEWDICKTDFDVSISYRQGTAKASSEANTRQKAKKGVCEFTTPRGR